MREAGAIETERRTSADLAGEPPLDGAHALARGATQLVPDVHAFPGHIACDAASRSELVVPIWHDGQVVAVIDLDSPEPARFDAEDAAGIEALARAIARAI